MVLVPALAEMAINLSKQFKKNMLGSDLKTVICGAATVSPYLVEEYDKIGVALLPGYGLTESANLVSGNPEAKSKPSSVGLIYDGMEYKVVDGELWLQACLATLDVEEFLSSEVGSESCFGNDIVAVGHGEACADD